MHTAYYLEKESILVHKEMTLYGQGNNLVHSVPTMCIQSETFRNLCDETDDLM